MIVKISFKCDDCFFNVKCKIVMLVMAYSKLYRAPKRNEYLTTFRNRRYSIRFLLLYSENIDTLTSNVSYMLKDLRKVLHFKI